MFNVTLSGGNYGGTQIEWHDESAPAMRVNELEYRLDPPLADGRHLAHFVGLYVEKEPGISTEKEVSDVNPE